VIFEHIETVHESIKPFKSNIYNANFTAKQHMKSHIDLVHEGKKPFNCNICSAAFS
jgi:hypothetical protein